jgi:hypothetical protein
LVELGFRFADLQQISSKISARRLRLSRKSGDFCGFEKAEGRAPHLFAAKFAANAMRPLLALIAMAEQCHAIAAIFFAAASR